MAKLEQVLPHRLRRQVDAVRHAMISGPENTGSNVEDPLVDAALLAAVAAAIRDHEEIRFDYRDDERCQEEPYRLISWQRRWYLVTREPRTDTWWPRRLDWMRLRTPGGRRFRPVELPGGDYPAFVLREVASTGWNVHARIAVDAPAEEVLARINPTVGVVETIDEHSCVLVTGRRQRRDRGGLHRHARSRLPRLRDPPELVASPGVAGGAVPTIRRRAEPHGSGLIAAGQPDPPVAPAVERQLGQLRAGRVVRTVDEQVVRFALHARSADRCRR